MSVKMNMLQQVAIGFFILCMLPLCTHLGIITFLERPEYQKHGWALEQDHRREFYKKNNIDPRSLQGSRDNKAVQARWQAAEDSWKASSEYAEFKAANKVAAKDSNAYQKKVSMIYYLLALFSILLSYALSFPIIATSYLLTAAYFISFSFISLPEQETAWLGLLMYGFLLALLLWMAMRRKDACQAEL